MGYGGIEAAKAKSTPARTVYAFGNMQDQWELAPDNVITGPIWNVYPTIKSRDRRGPKGRIFSARDYREFSFMYKGGSYLAPYHNPFGARSCPPPSKPWSTGPGTGS